ncbi:MAG: SH3 domain-containing protein [Bacteroidota bacterium]
MTRIFPSIRFLFLLGFVSYFFGCKNSEKELPRIEIETYSQSELTYPSKEVKIADATKGVFLQNFFRPWKLSPIMLMTSLDSLPGKELSYLQNYLNDDEWYGENKKPHKKFLREEIVKNVTIESFPNFLKKGIVIAHTNLRRIPSNRPGFDTYSKAGEGFPFDYFQETNLWANTPLQLLHISNDGQWCYVVSPYYKGWVAMHDLAVVSKEFIDQWQTGNYAMPLSDQVGLRNSTSNYALSAKMGMVLPFEEADNPEDVLVLYANSDEIQNAKILKAEVPKNKIALNDFAFEPTNLEHLVSNLIGRPYGWGGNLENRDCSSMIRDMMATYKIWLPRDSKDQIEIGQQYELTGSSEEKMKIIKDKGIPFRTILRKKGHNMLYVGDSADGEPLIFHAIWGLKTLYHSAELAGYIKQYPIEGVHQDEDNTLKGRHIIGEAVITSVNVGSENKGVTVSLLEEIYAMTNFLEQTAN